MLLWQSFYGLNKVKKLQKNCLHTGQCLNLAPLSLVLIQVLKYSHPQWCLKLQRCMWVYCKALLNFFVIDCHRMILRASAASWHLFWSHNLWMPGRSIHSRCPMTQHYIFECAWLAMEQVLTSRLIWAQESTIFHFGHSYHFGPLG